MVDSFFARMISAPARIRAEAEEQREEAQKNPHLMQALEENKRQGQIIAVRSRWVALAIIAVLLIYLIPRWSVFYYEAILVIFALLGWAQLKAATVGENRLELFLITLDLVLLTVTIIVPNPFDQLDWPTAMQYRFANFPYFYIFLAGATIAYSWRTTLSVGIMTAGLWMIALITLSFFGNVIPQLTTDVGEAVSKYPEMLELIDPNNPGIGLRIADVIVFLIVAGILAINGWRSNQLLLKQARSARERENLSRYFSPNIVDELADKDNPFSNIRSQKVAVMFADIVGFTRMAEHGNPEKVVALLREFHRRLEAAVFDNHGTLDKFLGDGIMATFGSPVTGPNDATNAMQCARDMIASLNEWNIERKQTHEAPIILSIGIHYGEVILGDIGSERRLEFAALGDTVNVAARLEELTRTMGTQILISNELVIADRECEAHNDNQFIDSFAKAGGTVLRGRDNEISLWKMKT